MVSASEPRLFGRTILLGCALLQPVVDIPSTLTGFWRGTSSFFSVQETDLE
jgi:hypothetical protein